jgi:hypothetical protein
MSGTIPPFPNTFPWRGAQLKHTDNFTFYLYLNTFMREHLIRYDHEPTPVYIVTFYSLKTRFNITLLSSSRSSKCAVSKRLTKQQLCINLKQNITLNFQFVYIITPSCISYL